jgi:hypothetical protein
MGYFSNGTEGEIYYETWCARCVHDDPDKEQYCPIWNLHLQHNYKGANDDSHFLHQLIPLSEDGLYNEQCRLFFERPEKEK